MLVKDLETNCTDKSCNVGQECQWEGSCGASKITAFLCKIPSAMIFSWFCRIKESKYRIYASIMRTFFNQISPSKSGCALDSSTNLNPPFNSHLSKEIFCVVDWFSNCWFFKEVIILLFTFAISQIFPCNTLSWYIELSHRVHC